jgi:hypothetical protein
MANTVFGPYTATSWTAGVTALNQTNMNHLETQTSVAMHGFNPDEIGAGFVYSGCAVTGTVGTTTVNIASGVVYTVMTDGTVGRITVGATTQTTSALSSTYHLYVQPDGTFYWSTSNTPAANSINLANVATNGSGQISSITDNRSFSFSLYSGAAGRVTLPTIGTLQAIRPTSGYDSLNLIATADATYTTIIGTGDGSYGGGTGLYMYDSKNADYICKGLSKSNFTINGAVTANNLGLTSVNAVTAMGSVSGNAIKIVQDSSHTSNSVYLNADTGGGLNIFDGLNSGTALISSKTATSINGKISSVGGQASAGSFGVPVIVAQALSQAVTTTGDQTILTYTPPAVGLYRVSGYAHESNGSASNLTFRFTYQDPSAGGTTTAYFSWNTTGSPAFLNAFAINFGTNLLFVSPITVYANTGTNIVVHWNNSAGTPSDHISVLIERLA